MLNECLYHDPTIDTPTVLTAHGIDPDDPLLDKSDVISHLMNGFCANHTTPACTEISRRIRSPVKMAIAIAEIVINGYRQGQVSARHFRDVCSAIGIKPYKHREGGPNLIKKLELRCKDLQPLLNCTDLDNIFSTIEGLGKRSPKELVVQHQVDLYGTHGVSIDDLKTQLVDHICSASCESSMTGLCASFHGDYRNTASSESETHVLRFASEKGNVSKKALRRILATKRIEFGIDDSINRLRQVLRSHITQLRKGKKSEWSQTVKSQEQHEHEDRLKDIRQNGPQPASMKLKEDCIRNLRVATSSESLRKFTCACCAESVNVSERKVIPVKDMTV